MKREMKKERKRERVGRDDDDVDAFLLPLLTQKSSEIESIWLGVWMSSSFLCSL